MMGYRRSLAQWKRILSLYNNSCNSSTARSYSCSILSRAQSQQQQRSLLLLASARCHDESHMSRGRFSSMPSTTVSTLDKIPIGFMTSSNWDEAETTLHDLCNLEQVTSERVRLAWKLLDRLDMEEQESISNSNSTNHRHVLLSTELLNQVVDAWRWRTKNVSKTLVYEPMEILTKVENYTCLEPDIRTFAMIVGAATKRGANSREAPKIAEYILKHMNHEIEVTNVFLNVTLSAFLKSGLPEAPYKAEALVNQYHTIADDVSYGIVIQCWARQRGASWKVQQILDKMTTPNVRASNAVIQSWVLNQQPQKAQAILDKMSKDDSLVQPNDETYRMVLLAWSKSNHPEAARHADRILQQMEQHSDIRPDKQCYTAVMSTWAEQGNPQSATRAEAILQRMQQMYEAGDTGMKPDEHAFASVLNAWAKCRSLKAAQRAEAILERMNELYEAGSYQAKPNAVIYTLVVSAYARIGTWVGAERAMLLLNRMHELYRAGNIDLKPNTITFTSVIAGFAKLKSAHAAERAESFLDRLQAMHSEGVTLNRFAFNSVINAWGKSGAPGSAQKAEAVLKRMLEHYEKGNKDCMPDRYSFTTVISAWSKVGDTSATERAACLFDVMNKLHESGVPGLRPDQHSFGALVAAVARSGGPSAGQKAEEILERMQRMHEAGNFDAKPNSVVLNSVITAWGRSSGDRHECAEKAESILYDMQELYEGGNLDVKPTIFTFYNVINAWAVCEDRVGAERAEDILVLMKKWNDEGRLDVMYDTVAFNSVITAWAKVGDRAAAEKADSILKMMLDLYDGGNKRVKPDSVTFNTVILAWINSSSDGDPLDTVERYFQTMKRLAARGYHDCKPCKITYGQLIKVWSASQRPGADEKVKALIRERNERFRPARQQGQVMESPIEQTVN